MITFFRLDGGAKYKKVVLNYGFSEDMKQCYSRDTHDDNGCGLIIWLSQSEGQHIGGQPWPISYT